MNSECTSIGSECFRIGIEGREQSRELAQLTSRLSSPAILHLPRA